MLREVVLSRAGSFASLAAASVFCASGNEALAAAAMDSLVGVVVAGSVAAGLLKFGKIPVIAAMPVKLNRIKATAAVAARG